MDFSEFSSLSNHLGQVKCECVVHRHTRACSRTRASSSYREKPLSDRAQHGHCSCPGSHQGASAHRPTGWEQRPEQWAVDLAAQGSETPAAGGSACALRFQQAENGGLGGHTGHLVTATPVPPRPAHRRQGGSHILPHTWGRGLLTLRRGASEP